MAESLIQYWTDCTRVTERMPPAATLRVTMTVSTVAPTQVGSPET